MHCGTKQKQLNFFEGEDELYLEEFYDVRSNGYNPQTLVATNSKCNFCPKFGQGLNNICNVPTVEMKCFTTNVMCG